MIADAVGGTGFVGCGLRGATPQWNAAVMRGMLPRGVARDETVVAASDSSVDGGSQPPTRRSKSPAASSGWARRSGDTTDGGNCDRRRYRRRKSGRGDPVDLSCGGDGRVTKRGGAGPDDGAGSWS